METIEDLTVKLILPGAGLARAVERRLGRWAEERFAERLWAADPSLWSPGGPPFPPELEDRLGWLDLPDIDPGELAAFAEEVRRDGLRHAVLLGMGGSSLAPEVFHDVLGARPGYPELTVLDSTHPEAVRAVRQDLEATGGPARTLFLVASKSGTTVETLSLFRYFWQEVADASPEPGGRFVAITDPGTPLAEMAGERGFRRVFLAPPDVGGRYSALSVFGLVPAGSGGVDLGRLLARLGGLRERLRAPAPENPGLRLAAALAEAAALPKGAGRDKLTFLPAPALARLPAWIEQLVAESLGKDGRGIVPVADEPVLGVDAYGPDRLFVSLELDESGGEDGGDGRSARSGAGSLDALAAAGHPVVRITLPDRHHLAGAMLLWEVATAAAGAALGVHPFDQPDVELAKRRAKEAMAGGGAGAAGIDEVSAHDEERLRDALAGWLGDAGAGSDGEKGEHRYVALQAFLPPTPEIDHDLRELRLLVADRRGLATTAGYGPRFLHSTGQLHKGGPATGLFLQLVDEPAAEVPVPGAGHGFGELIRAQGVGDYRALVEAGRRVLRVQLGRDRAGGLARLQDVFEDAL